MQQHPLDHGHGLLPGQRHDLVGVKPIIEDIHFDGLLADKAFDAD